jgi:hypothetical protein
MADEDWIAFGDIRDDAQYFARFAEVPTTRVTSAG